MNDEFLFKAKSVSEGVWYTVFLMYVSGKSCCILDSKNGNGYVCKTDTICRCTGWKDKEKNIIWENDTVTDGNFVGDVKFGYYTWDESENIGFYIDWNKVDYRKDLGFWLDKISVIRLINDSLSELRERK